MSTEYESVRSTCLETGELWTDPDFPANHSSLFRQQILILNPVLLNIKTVKIIRIRLEDSLLDVVPRFRSIQLISCWSWTQLLFCNVCSYISFFNVPFFQDDYNFKNINNISDTFFTNLRNFDSKFRFLILSKGFMYFG